MTTRFAESDKDLPCLVDWETREDCICFAGHKLKDGMIAVELGSYLGGSVILLAQALREMQVKIYAIDNWKCENISQPSLDWSGLNTHDQVWPQFNANLVRYGMENLIKPIVSNTISAAKLFADKSVNYLFHDASHNFQELVDELEAWKPKLADNAFCFVHDAPSDEVNRAIHRVYDLNKCTTVRGGSSIIVRNTL